MMTRAALTWVHISDIHFGQGAARSLAERSEIREALIEDICSLAQRIPEIDQIIVSGDIAYSGGALSQQEYTEAQRFFDRLVEVLCLDRDAVLLIPGNHDVDRGVAQRDHDTRRWLKEFRDDGLPIEEAFASERDRMRLRERFASYLRFAGDYGPAFDEAADISGQDNSQPLYWTTVIDGHDDLRIRIAGGNSALLCQGDDDEGKLQIGLQQFREIVRPEGDQDVTILVTHHPVDWCRDRDDIESRIRRCVYLHLRGYVHRASSEYREHVGGGNVV